MWRGQGLGVKHGGDSMGRIHTGDGIQEEQVERTGGRLGGTYGRNRVWEGHMEDVGDGKDM